MILISIKVVNHRAIVATEQNVPFVVFNNVNKNYGRIYALSGINLAISGGVTGVLGLNGAGKSTLFNILIGR